MDMSKQLARLMQHRAKRKKGDTAQLAAQLAPLEEQNRHAAQQQGGKAQGPTNGAANREPGSIVVDTGSLMLPKGIVEAEERKGRRGIEPVVLVILSVMLAFIAFIAWQISQMPAQ
jgi:hypothetical protein